MLYASDFRRIARNSLRGRWPLAVGTGFVAGLLGADIANLVITGTILPMKTLQLLWKMEAVPFLLLLKMGNW